MISDQSLLSSTIVLNDTYVFHCFMQATWVFVGIIHTAIMQNGFSFQHLVHLF